MPLTPEQIAEMDQEFGAMPQTSLAPEQVADMDKAFGLEPRSLPEEAARKFGIGTRAALTGLSGVVALPADTVVSGINYFADKNLKMPSQGFQESLSNTFALPTPETQGERLTQDAIAAGASASPMGLAAVAPSVASGLSAGMAREMGVGPLGQMVAGLLGGTATATGAKAASVASRYVTQGVKDITRPLYQSGREKIVGDILNKNVANRTAAIQSIQNAPEYVPGSPFTTGEAAQDVGLMSLQRGMRNAKGNPFADIESQQNAARNAYLDQLAGSKAGLEAAKQTRAAQTSQLREQAFSAYDANPVPVNAQKAVDVINQKIMSPLANNSDVRTTMMAAKDEILSALNMGDPRYAYELRKNLANASAKKLAQASGGAGVDFKKYQRLAAGQLTDVLTTLDDEIEAAAPGYRQYMSEYQRLSKPINQMETLQEIAGDVRLNAAPDVQSGYQFLSQPKLTGILADETGDLAKTLAPEQLQGLRNIEADMVRSASLNARNIRPVGSDTAFNQNVLSQALESRGGPIGRAFASFGRDQINDMLTEAMRDPQYALKILQKVQPEATRNPVEAQKILFDIFAPALAGTSATAGKQEVPQ